ncbi:MAG: IS30 family transposase, partial [Tepidisphaeraceae bacterium]
QVSYQRVARIAMKLNNRPRKCLDYRTPAEVLGSALRL